MEDYKKLFEAGNKAQLEKLKENEHKKGFGNIGFEYAFLKLTKKIEELGKSFYIPIYEKDYIQNVKNIRGKTADIGNYANMIILHCDSIIEKFKNNRKEK